MTDFSHISHVENFLHVTDFPYISHAERYLHVTEFITWRNFPLENMSWGKFLHMTIFFSTDAVCGVCDKYQVWIFSLTRFNEFADFAETITDSLT